MADQATFVEDTEPFMSSLFSTAMRMTNNRADAEDLDVLITRLGRLKESLQACAGQANSARST